MRHCSSSLQFFSKNRICYCYRGGAVAVSDYGGSDGHAFSNSYSDHIVDADARGSYSRSSEREPFYPAGPRPGVQSDRCSYGWKSVTAFERDVLANWLQIPVPDQPGKMGWVSIQSHFSVVSGDVMSLPEYTQTEWPVGASFQNCTHHQMEVDPLGIFIPSVDNFPDNEILMNPGTYIIRDTDVEGSPVVSEVQLREGSAVDIRTDGNGERKNCPLP